MRERRVASALPTLAGVTASRRHWVVPGVVIGMAATLAGASTGSGTFRFDKVTTKFSSACAFRVPDPLVAGKTQTTIVLAEQPIDCAAADAGFDPVAAARAQGRIGGRPRKLSAEKLKAAQRLLQDPDSTVSGVARTLGVHRSTVHRVLQKLDAKKIDAEVERGLVQAG